MLILCTFVSVILFGGISIFNTTGMFAGVTVIIVHSLYGGIWQSVYWTWVTKITDARIMPVVTAIACSINDLALILLPLFAGHELGIKGTQNDMIFVCSVFGGFCCLGMFGISYLACVNEYIYNSGNHSVSSRVIMTGTNGQFNESNHPGVEAGIYTDEPHYDMNDGIKKRSPCTSQEDLLVENNTKEGSDRIIRSKGEMSPQKVKIM